MLGDEQVVVGGGTAHQSTHEVRSDAPTLWNDLNGASQMNAPERIAAVSLPIILVIGALVALAESDRGAKVSDLPIFAICAAVSFGINWLIFLPSFAARTERFFDLAGSLTYLSLLGVALVLPPGDPDHRSILLAGLVFVWAARLGTFLFARIHRAGGDPGFSKIKQSFLRFLMAWTLHGLWVLLTAACALAAMTSDVRMPLGTFAVVGGVLWLIGFSFEVIADRQKSAFNADPANKGKFIATELWAWSRHPNYFGEIVLWLGIAVIAYPALSGWQLATLVSPVFVFVLLTRISGIPLLEARGRKKFGSDQSYADYRTRTPALFPRPPLGKRA